MAYLSKAAIVADGENADSVVQAVCSVDEVAVGGDANFRGEVRTGESRRHTGDDLLWRKISSCGVEMPEHDRRRFFLNGVQPDPIGVEREMSGSIARRRIHEGGR